MQRRIAISESQFIQEKTGADALVETLVNSGVKVIFCITGAGNLAIVDSLVRNGQIDLVFSHHEQAAVMEAQGYARVTGDIGVALVTTGGGTSNITTGVLSAHLDSVPILIISGNESSFHCENIHNLRAYGVQGFDSVATLKPITKSSLRISSSDSVYDVTRNQINLALEDRMGPTHIDFPMDLQRNTCSSDSKLRKPQPETVHDSANDHNEIWLEELIGAIKLARKPLVYLGNGARFDIDKVLYFIETLGIPFIESWSALDLIPENHQLKVGRVGIYGDRSANIILQQSDLVITFGTRLSIPQTGYDRSDFARKATKWVIEIDKTECDKFAGLGWKVLNSPLETALNYLNQKINEKIPTVNFQGEWLNRINSIKDQLPRLAQCGTRSESFIHSVDAIRVINKSLDENAVIVTDVGAGLLSGHYVIERTGAQRIFTSQGLGEMGFGLPGAVGAYFADKNRQIVCLNTDGAIMFNLQELQVVKEHKIPIKLFIFNNCGYSMIKISQNNLFNSRLSGSTTESGLSFPEFEQVAKAFGLKYAGFSEISNLESQIDQVLNSSEGYLIEILMDPGQKYLPRLSTIKLANGSLMSPALEDLEPLIEIDVLAKLLGYDPSPSSFSIRGLSA